MNDETIKELLLAMAFLCALVFGICMCAYLIATTPSLP
jgi:hypothetical protein